MTVKEDLSGSGPKHWIVTVAIKAALAGAETLNIDPKTPLLEAWREVTSACRVSDDDLAAHAANHYRVGLADFSVAEEKALKLLPEKLARRYGVVPLQETDREIVVATADPSKLDVERDVAFASGRKPVFRMAPPAKVQDALDERYVPWSAVWIRAERSKESEMSRELKELVRVMPASQPEHLEAKEAEAAPVVKLTNLILDEGIRAGASDIHIEPGRSVAEVRFRVDGVLRHEMDIPMGAHIRVLSRIKIMCSLDISERHRPQDGRTRIEIEGKHYDLRISTIPMRESEKVVMRVLDPSKTQRLDDLGMAALELKKFRHLLTNHDGLVVVTGPTGCGKTTTLYSGIRELITGKLNITTIESPVEYELPGINQIQIDTQRGVTFASALRAILRQDPDVIFVGEIRDLETAEVAIQASSTGHLVLGTLHTNDAAGVVSRFADFGLDRSKIAENLRGVLAQRLIRRICSNCAAPVGDSLNPKEEQWMAVYGVRPVKRAVGCAQCGQSGYRGRMQISEMLVNNAQIAELIMTGATALQLQPAAVASGMRPMREVALERVQSGETTFQEMERVLGEIELSSPAKAAQKQHILLVDDDPVNRLIERNLLEKQGFEVSEAEDGADGLGKIQAQDANYSLVVLDLEMPRMGGEDVLRHVRRDSDLPIIILTGTNDQEAEVRVMEEGADDYIRKPLDPARFIARIKGTLRRASL